MMKLSLGPAEGYQPAEAIKYRYEYMLRRWVQFQTRYLCAQGDFFSFMQHFPKGTAEQHAMKPLAFLGLRTSNK